MKTTAIRTWMVRGMVLFLGLAALFYHITNLLDQNVLQPLTHQQSAKARQVMALDAAQREVAGSPASWHDPAWQTSLRDRLDRLGVEALVRDPSGSEVFHTGSAAASEQPGRQVVVVDGTDGGRQLGTVELFVPQGTFGPPVPVPVAGAVLAVVLALLFVHWQMGRYVVRPLEAMSLAARRIAGGNLDFEIPESRVREVADVRDAFGAMGEGLRAALKRQAGLEEQRRFFIGAIAHDLRTPIFSLRGYLEGLEQGLASSPDKAARYVGVCRQKADQLDRLVSDLFAYSRLEYLEQTLHPGPLEIGSLLRRSVEGVRTRARDRGVAIEMDGDGDACMAQGDEHLLERAVENLLDNALRYTPAGGKIEVGWGRDERRVVFTVADTGPGIAPSDLPHLFDPLYRGETSRNQQTGGAGLGLAIARRALLAAGGDLMAANRPAGGAQFTGWLPPHSDAPAVLPAH